jgi:copper transport protein
LTRRSSGWSDGLIGRPLELRTIAVLAAVAIGLTAPSPAAGHAGLVSVTPANGAVVDVAPAQVVLRFNQPVKADLVRIFDGVARPVAVGRVTPSPYEVAAPIEGTLPRGSYTVVWRVISDDVDPVSDFLFFHVSARRAEAAAPAAGASEDDGGVGLLLPALLAGGAALALAVAFAVRRAYLPLPGPWRLRVAARRGVSGRYAATVTGPVPAG